MGSMFSYYAYKISEFTRGGGQSNLRVLRASPGEPVGQSPTSNHLREKAVNHHPDDDATSATIGHRGD